MHATAPMILALLGSIVTSAQAAASVKATGQKIRATQGYGYATFYDDHACTQNAGEAVDIGNGGCLANEIGRNSIYVQPGLDEETMGNTEALLIWSPGTSCDCQNDCALVQANGGSDYCWDLAGRAEAQSFRFTGGTCGANNC